MLYSVYLVYLQNLESPARKSKPPVNVIFRFRLSIHWLKILTEQTPEMHRFHLQNNVCVLVYSCLSTHVVSFCALLCVHSKKSDIKSDKPDEQIQ